MKLLQQIQKLLKEVGPGRMMITAYDTAWIARLGELGEPIGERALNWLREHQLEDGSWGAPQPYYHHDRVVSTLAAINALARRGRVQDRERLRRAEKALEAAIGGLHLDPAGETVGFELIVPTLLYEAKALGAIHHPEDDVLRKLAPLRSAKLAMLPRNMISRSVSTAFSSEMAGYDNQKLLDKENLQENNGSVGLSPSATAYFALYVSRRDKRAMRYLRRIASGGAAPNASPFDIFEQTWTLWNLSLIGDLDSESLGMCQKHLDFLEAAWVPGIGVGFALDYTPKDGDDTSLAYDVLTHFGRTVDLEAVIHYEHVYHFRCFELESSPSVSANIHVLSALRRAGLEKQHPSVQKVLLFLKAIQTDKGFWLDKWHSSPYYATAQAVIACAGYEDEVVASSIDWICETQNEDGAWGYYMPTAEETAYCLQALCLWERYGNEVPVDGIIERGHAWLMQHTEPPYLPLWIAKCLYCPKLIVRSVILSALMLVAER